MCLFLRPVLVQFWGSSPKTGRIITEKKLEMVTASENSGWDFPMPLWYVLLGWGDLVASVDAST